uniref:NADH-ubiquinone oxidoreductase chain 4 n=1 Tax=Diplostomum spathaceum TaxID=183647 RepID=A0A0H4T245_9TREM|nr:NADH dehydrogenase subunit 4 [Diplostomum spathaceum]
MKFKFVDWYCWFVVFFSLGSMFIIWFYTSFSFSSSLISPNLASGSYFIFDSVGFYLSLLSILLMTVLVFFYSIAGARSLFYISLSIFSSLLCYCCNYVFFFWFFYEVSILSLLFLLIVDSPYSERYLAGWYLSGYVVLTSLPMLLCLVYFSLVRGSLFISDWYVDMSLLGDYSLDYCVFIILGVLFVTKIPAPPFHTWLPIVHAEATSLVSVCLSGYIMKLGLLGVCRFCWLVIPDFLFGLSYVSVSFFLAILFFLAASWELDGKRWLALLSLSHIIICVVCFNSGTFDNANLLFLYSLGHGLSAGAVFILLWWGYNLSGSRNWMILKFIFGGSLFFRILLCLGLCTVASLPPVIQFFVEVSLLVNVGAYNLVLFIIFCVYLFFSSLIPLFFLGGLMSRHFCVVYNGFTGCLSFGICLLFLFSWCFVIFLIV